MSAKPSPPLRFVETSRPSSARLPVAILLFLCFLSFTAAFVRQDAPAWVEVVQYAE